MYHLRPPCATCDVSDSFSVLELEFCRLKDEMTYQIISQDYHYDADIDQCPRTIPEL